MTKMTSSSNVVTPPAWAGDYFDRAHMISGGQVVATGFTADAEGRKPILSGTLIGRTYAEQVAGTGFGPADDADDEMYLVAFDVTDAVDLPDVELYRHGSMVKEDLLPEWGDPLSAAKIAYIRANYATMQSAA